MALKQIEGNKSGYTLENNKYRKKVCRLWRTALYLLKGADATLTTPGKYR